MKFKNFILGIGILVVFALALHQGLETFYSTPQYDDYCDFRPGPLKVKNPSVIVNCPDNVELDRKAQQCWDSKGEFVYEYDSNGCVVEGYCDGCRIDYEKALDVHSSRIFIISVLIGIIVFVTGFFMLKTEPVGSALMASGIWAVFFGVVRNWRNFSDSWKFLLLFVLFIVLIWVALRFNRKTSTWHKLKNKFRR